MGIEVLNLLIITGKEKKNSRKNSFIMLNG